MVRASHCSGLFGVLINTSHRDGAAKQIPLRCQVLNPRHVQSRKEALCLVDKQEQIKENAKTERTVPSLLRDREFLGGL